MKTIEDVEQTHIDPSDNCPMCGHDVAVGDWEITEDGEHRTAKCTCGFCGFRYRVIETFCFDSILAGHDSFDRTEMLRMEEDDQPQETPKG